MDSPFNRGFGPGHQSPALSQAPPAGSAYQVNVNRTKTKKWVEARVHSYDGDDWGDDEYGDDEPEPEPEQKPVPPMAQQSTVKQPPVDAPVHAPVNAPVNATDHLPSSLQSQSQAQAPPAHQPRLLPAANPELPTNETPVGRHTTHSPHPAPFLPSEPSVETSTRPSEIARRIDDDDQRHRAPAADTGAIVAELPSNSRMLDSSDGKGALSGDGGRRDSASPQLPDVARMSAFGVDLFASTGSGRALQPPISEHGGDDSVSPSPSVKDDRDTLAFQSETAPSHPLARNTQPGLQQRRQSTSQEADGRDASVKDLAPHSKPEETKEVASSSADDKHAVDNETFSASSGMALAHPQARTPSWHLESGWPTVPPLRTPSPRASIGDVVAQAAPRGMPPNLDDRGPVQAADTLQQRQPGEPGEPGEPGHGTEHLPARCQSTSTASIISSPAKDNDVLSDEILRSLSPAASSSAGPSSGDGRKTFPAPNPAAVRDSSYTLHDYDSYWADTSDKARAVAPSAAVAETKALAELPPETSGLDEKEQADEPGSRKRFSWEAGEEALANPLPADSGPQPVTAHELAASLGAQSVQPPQSPPADAQFPESDDAAPRALAELDGGQEPLELLQPPSPLDDRSSEDRDSMRLSRAGGPAQPPDSPSISTLTPPPESMTSPVGQPPSEAAEPQNPHHAAHAPSMTFREILSLPASAERIIKYNESRHYFASADTGLNTWLETLQAQNPEYVNEPESLAAATSHPLAQAESHLSSAGAQLPAQQAQQPYYQQYLNATAPGTSSTASRSRLGGSHMASQSTGSTFGHPSHQIGFKSKELMHSAGKMGKGLLSKGKNKLRGSGDKDESASFPVHANLKNYRRSSWAFGLGARPRPEEALAPGPLTTPASITTPSSPIDPHQQVPQSPQVTETPTHGIDHPDNAPPACSPRPRGPADRVTAGLHKLEIPTSKGDGVMRLGVAGEPAVQDRPLKDSAEVSRQEDEQRRASPEHNSVRHRVSSQIERDAAPQSDMQAQDDLPRRISSFVGLPPIRRSSTFGITARAKRATRRFSLDDDDIADSHGEGESSMVRHGSCRAMEPAEPLSPLPPSLLQAGSSTKPGPGPDLEGKSRAFQPQEEQPRTAEPFQPRGKPQGRHASYEAVLPVQTRLSPMLASPGLATGPWKLEESHLAEPLNPVTRHRPGTPGSRKPMFYGYDKETGSPDHQQQTFVDTPPSSAQRWPDLFSQPVAHGVPRPRSYYRAARDSDTYSASTPPLRETASRGSRYAEPEPGTVQSPQSEGGLGIFNDLDTPILGTTRVRPSLSHEAQPTAFKINDGPRDHHQREQSDRLPDSAGHASPGVGGHDGAHPYGLEATKKKKRLSNMINLASFRDMFHGSGTDRGRKSNAPQTPSGGIEQHDDGPGAPPPAALHDTGRRSTSVLDSLSPQPTSRDRPDGVAKRSSVSGLISDLLGRKPALSHERQAPRHAHSSSDLQVRHRNDALGAHPYRGVLSAGANSRGPLRPFSSGWGAQASRDQADSADAPYPSSRLGSDKPPQLPEIQPRSSSFDIGVPMMTGDGNGEAARQRTRGIRLVPQVPGDDERQETRKPPLDSPRKGNSGAHQTGRSPLTGIGAQHGAAGEAAYPGNSTLSPELPVISDRKAGEEQATRPACSSHGSIINDAAPSPVGSGVVVGGTQSGAARREQGRRGHGLPRDGPGDGGTSAHLQHAGPATGPRSRVGLGIADPSSGHVSPGQSSLSPVPQASLQGESSWGPSPSEPGLHPGAQAVDPAPAGHLHAHGTLAGAAGPEPSKQKKQRQPVSGQADGLGSRWKGLKHRMSEQRDRIASQYHERADGKAGSKLLDALKRISKSPEPTQGATCHQGGAHGPPQEQPRHPRQPSPGQGEGQNAMQPAGSMTPAQSQQSSPFVALSPKPGQAGVSPAELERRMQAPPGQWGRENDQVMDPQGHQSIQRNGLVSPAPSNAERHMATGRHARLNQAAHGGHAGLVSPLSQQSPPMSHKSPVAHDSASSPGTGPASPLGSIDDGRQGGFRPDLLCHPSMDSLGARQVPRPGQGEGTERRQALVRAPSVGHDQAGSQSPAPGPGCLPETGNGQKITTERAVGEQGVERQSAPDAGDTRPEGGADLTEHQKDTGLRSQEEKILLEAEDGREDAPHMSATSWPGQEWNPFGEPGLPASCPAAEEGRARQRAGSH